MSYWYQCLAVQRATWRASGGLREDEFRAVEEEEVVRFMALGEEQVNRKKSDWGLEIVTMDINLLLSYNEEGTKSTELFQV